MDVKRNCLVCGKDMLVRPDKIALGEGKYCSQQCHGKVKMSEDNPNWRGEDATLLAIHRWVERRLHKPTICPICSNPGWMDLHNVDSKYSRNLEDWIWLCRRCHMTIDGRINRRVNGRYAKKETNASIIEA